MTSGFIQQLSNRVTRLKNLRCPYCGGRSSREKPLTYDHVVGRRFVPKGALAGGWNLIVQACQSCNTEKSDLEDDISAVTLQPDLQEGHSNVDLDTEARRKAGGSISRRTKKLVVDSHESFSLEGQMMPGVKATVGFVGPPQLDPERVRKLAAMHLRAFFYLMSYDAARLDGGFVPGDIGHLFQANRPDWGNPLMRGFAELIRMWDLQLSAVCAQGFFKIIIRKDLSSERLWAFAIEWNAKHRLIGFFGDMEVAQRYVNELPELQWKRFDASHRYREEIPLEADDDFLFATPELAAGKTDAPGKEAAR
jgi:hypothetical protein